MTAPLTNAERQRRFRQKQKAMVASSAAGLKETIEKAIAEYNREYAREPDFEPFTIADYIYHLAGGDVDSYAVEWITKAINATIFDSLAVADPWPGLTREKLRDMIGEARKGQARDRGLGIAKDGWRDSEKGAAAPPLTLHEKICAAHNRDWLLDGAAVKVATKKAEKAEKRRAAKEAKFKAEREALEKARNERLERIAADAERKAAPKKYTDSSDFGRF